MKKVYSLLLLCFLSLGAYAQTTTYSVPGAYVYTVGSCVTSLQVDLAGGKGGNYPSEGAGGNGGRVQATIAVTPGQVLYVYVGAQGAASCYNTCGGVVPAGGSSFGGGEDGGAGSISDGGAAGGAASDIRTSITGGASSVASLNTRLVVAGGGGGGAWDCGVDYGGGGGGTTGGTGYDCSGYNAGQEGGPGTPSAPGAAGYYAPLSYSGSPGGFGYGGNAYFNYYGGGGGGGWYGGGGAAAGGGCGGSSYYGGAGVSAATTTASYNAGNGYVSIIVPCNAPGTILGSNVMCAGTTATLTDPTAGTTGVWSSSNPAIATIGTSSGVVTALAAGSVTITYTISSPCGCSSATMTLTVNAAPPAITGTATMCVGGSSTLSDPTSGGVWSSSNTGQATVGSTGFVNGVSAGNPTISYTVSGCTSTQVLTINPLPATPASPVALCPGATSTLTDATSGGTWSSSNPSLATVGSSSGTVTAVSISGGNPIITYTLGTGCLSTLTITVNAMQPIVGSLGTCTIGSSTTLGDATAGGVWTSSNTGVATIGSLSGVVTSVGSGLSNITYFVPGTGCSATAVFGVTGVPNVYTMTGGGSYCSGSTGVVMGLTGSDLGVNYQLMISGVSVGVPVSGSGGVISFAPQTTAGTYNVVANPGSSCATNMTGTGSVVVNPLPGVVSVTGGGSYCSGGSGVHVGTGTSVIGINYQLFNSGSSVGSPVPGTGAALDFGLLTGAGIYTVTATNATTGCTNGMSGSATITVNPLPTVFNVTGGGGYCAGGTGVTIGLSGSQSGVNYQLMLSGAPVSGALLPGSGSSLSFGLQTVTGTYTVVATNATTSCVNTMASSVTVSVNPLPTVFSMTGGGAYCSGGTGVHVGLNSSTSGVSYQLYRGIATVGSAVTGTGAALDFGLMVVPGSYSVVATTASGCTLDMSGSALVSINPLPVGFLVTGGGSYCAGGTGVHVGLSASEPGITYNLYNGVALSGAATGTGSSIDFGLETAAGYYTVVATNPLTGCSNNMGGSATVTINPLPTIYTVIGGGNYCAGGTGVHIGLSNSNIGVNYQLFNGASTSGASVAGTGASFDFGLRTAAGSYTAVATIAATGCTSIQSGSASVGINPLPPTFTVTGTGAYCAGGTGTHIGLSGSTPGYSYQLSVGGAVSGAPMSGTGFPLDFGLQTVAGVYSVTATSTSTGCTNSMTGGVTVVINALPTPYLVTGGGPYCAGSTGVHVGVANSTLGIVYQLFNGTSPVGSPVAGTGSSIDFGLQTTAGTYSVVATNTATSCSNNMSGSATISVIALPTAFNVTGGGGYCAGGTGVHVGLAATTAGISYQLLNGGVISGLPVTGTGAALDFGLQTAAGTYTVLATNTLTSCTKLMTGSVAVTINALPTAFLVTGGGNYCLGATGVHIGLANSTTGVNYQLTLGGSPVLAPVAGTGAALDFGLQTAVGTYGVTATNTTTGCTRNMSGTPVVNINTLPILQTVTGGGNYCPGGVGVNVGLGSSESGVNYQLYNGAAPIGSPIAGTGSALGFGLETTPGTYTVKGTNATTGCTGPMNGSAIVGISPLPTAYNMTGTGNYCPGGSGRHVGLGGSDLGVTYQLYNTFGTVGVPIAGTGLPIDFGLELAGTYTAIATSTSTTCTNNMNGNATVNVSPLPNPHIVTGGGTYCAGGVGVHVGLDGSDAGTQYQLNLGATPVGSPISGTGSAIDFGLQTGAGIYTVTALSTGTACSATMTGSTTVAISPAPTAFTVMGGGGYCTGGTGVHVTLSGSASGIHYQLYRSGVAVGGAVAGTGAILDFGAQTGAGTYTVVGTNVATGCMNNMASSVNVTINTPPIAYTVSGGGGYCSGGMGRNVLLSGSNTGVSYQLYIGGITPTGTALAGTGFGLDFGPQTMAGNYTVRATDGTSGCVNNMTGFATVTINALPHVYSIASTTSNYCIGGAGVDISLPASDTGVSYQLLVGTAPVGAPVMGTGGVVDFGYKTPAGMYTVAATNAATGCSDLMASSVTVVIDPLPIAYTLTGTGGYCAGSTGTHIGLSGSNTGHTYQLYVDGVPTGPAVSGTGSALDFGLQTTIGTYSVIATNTLTTCTNNMSNTIMVTVNPVPGVYAVTGGGGYCAGGTGVHVGVGGSQVGYSYQLYLGGVLTGAPVTGTGGPVDFGLLTTAGSYTIVGINPTTGCSSNMLGAATVTVETPPAAYPVIGGGNYCTGGMGVHVGLGSSQAGVSYQLYNGMAPMGSPMTSSGPAIDFGLQTATGTYTVIGTDGTTGCTSTMSGSATVGLNALPMTFNVTGGGSYCSGTGGVHVGLNGSQTGIAYQLMDGVVAIGTPVSGTGGILDFGLQTGATTYTVVARNTSTTCVANMAGTATVVENMSVTPIVNIVTASGDTLCAGNFTTFTAVPVNGGTTPTYQWSVNGVAAGTSATYGYIPLNGDMLSVTMTSNATCATPLSTTRAITLNVEVPGTPTVTVAAYPGNEICRGTSVNFAATPTFGGTAPSFTWIVNGSSVGTAMTYSYTPANGDDVYAVMSSNYKCRLANPATSNHINMIVDVSMTPTVTVTATNGASIAAGQTAIFDATVSGAGAAPTYQWEVNGVPVPGATTSIFASNMLNDMDVVSCEVWSSGGCAGILGSGSVTVHVSTAGVQQINTASSDIRVVPNPNKGTFTVKGTLGTTADETATVEITDMIGQVIYTGTAAVRGGEVNERIQLTSVANGMYIMTLRTAEGNKVFHLVVEQ